MKKQFASINAFKYHMFNILFILCNTVLICNLYDRGWFGEVSENLYSILRLFLLENLFNPVDVLLYIALLVSLWYLRKKDDSQQVTIEMKAFRIIFLTIIILLAAGVIFLYQMRNQGGASLLAFVMIFYIPVIFNYCYVEFSARNT